VFCKWQVFGAFDFVWHYALPVTIFAYCYSHIFRVVKRHRKIVCIHVANAAAASRDGNTLQIQQQATGATTASPKLSRIQLNILETMIAVIVCFIVCWTPSSLTNIVQSITVCSLFLVHEKSYILCFELACLFYTVSHKTRATLFWTITPIFVGGFLHLLHQWKQRS